MASKQSINIASAFSAFTTPATAERQPKAKTPRVPVFKIAHTAMLAFLAMVFDANGNVPADVRTEARETLARIVDAKTGRVIPSAVTNKSITTVKRFRSPDGKMDATGRVVNLYIAALRAVSGSK